MLILSRIVTHKTTHYIPCIVLFGLIKQFSTMGSKMRAVVMDSPGGAEQMRIGLVDRPDCQDNDVLIKVSGSAINRADILQRKGSYPPPKGESTILGLEASGIVESVGKNVSSFQKGEQVMALLGGGGYAEYAVADYRSVIKVPGTMDLTTAAAIPETFLTAFQLLTFVGNMTPGKTVLIHAGGSGVGTAATQLVKLLGGKAFVTAGTAAKLEMAKSLGASLAVNYKEEDFSEVILKATEGRGVDMILDCIGASYWEKNIRSLALDGQWVLYGLMGGASIDGPLLAQILRKRAQLLGSTLRTRSKEYKGSLIESFSSRVMPHLASGDIHPIIDRVFPLDGIVDAHRHMEAAANIGKICLKIASDDSSNTRSDL